MSERLKELKGGFTVENLEAAKRLIKEKEPPTGKHYAYCDGKLLEVNVKKRPKLKVLRNRLAQYGVNLK